MLRLLAADKALRLFAADEAETEDRFGFVMRCLCGLVVVFWDRRDTVSTPFPKQLEGSGLNRAYSVFVSCLEDIPSMLEVSLVWSLASSCVVSHFIRVEKQSGTATFRIAQLRRTILYPSAGRVPRAGDAKSRTLWDTICPPVSETTKLLLALTFV